MKIKLTTNHGVITLELDSDKAPKTAANFLAYVKAGHYNGVIFHRVIGDFMVQTGGYTLSMTDSGDWQVKSRDGRVVPHTVDANTGALQFDGLSISVTPGRLSSWCTAPIPR